MDKDKLVELAELAERCEAATGQDRELDVEIALECAPIAQRLRNLMAGSPHNTIAEIAREADRDNPHIYIPRYTASLDAAMTLVDRAWRKRACDMDNGDCFFGIEVDDDTPEIGARAKTWPLSICAAALRSHAQPK